MALDALIVRFGLPAVFIGAGIEGEPFAIAGGFLAHRHLVPLWARDRGGDRRARC